MLVVLLGGECRAGGGLHLRIPDATFNGLLLPRYAWPRLIGIVVQPMPWLALTGTPRERSERRSNPSGAILLEILLNSGGPKFFE